MNEDVLKRREGESKYTYIKRLIEGKLKDKTLSEYDHNEIYESIFDKKISSTEARKRNYGILDCIEYFEEELEQFINNMENSEESSNEDGNTKMLDAKIKELEEKTKEFKKEKVKYQDQKREYHNYLRADARFEHLKEVMVNSIKDLNNTKPLEVKVVEDKGNKHMVVMLSDWHYGLQEENYWNKVNIEILTNRIEKLQNKIIKLISLHDINTVHIEILGDMINGLIHVTTRISNEEDVAYQTTHCSELLANFINNIANNVTNVKVYGCTGNHGRCVANAKDSLDTENFEKIIFENLKPRVELSRLKANKECNVEFVENKYDDSIICYKFLNEIIFSVHGHEDKIRTAVDKLSKMLKIIPTEIHMGHYHTYYEKDGHDISMVINGCASGTDKYAKHLREFSTPMQVVMIYDNEGRECTYKVKL